MDFQIEDKSYRKFAILGGAFALPAVLLWLSAGLWSLSGLNWLRAYLDVSAMLPNSLQLIAFAGFPVVTLVSGAWAVKKSRTPLTISVLILGVLIIGLTSLALVR